MSETNDIPAIMSHVSVGTNRFEEAVAFYDRVLATIGARRMIEVPGVKAIAYGKQFPEFWVQAPIDGKPASVGNGSHFGFLAPTKEAVERILCRRARCGCNVRGRPRRAGALQRGVLRVLRARSRWPQDRGDVLGHVERPARLRLTLAQHRVITRRAGSQ
ncbi:MAG: hypothetical protein QM803_20330 [Rhodocyclaceae bacterium]